jgi:transcriptional regulator with PAS, ATPase and Fis domain
MKKDMSDLKLIVADLISDNINKPNLSNIEKANFIRDYSQEKATHIPNETISRKDYDLIQDSPIEYTEEFVEETFSLSEKEKELILKALEKHNGKRKIAALELGISERTLYRKIKEYGIQ